MCITSTTYKKYNNDQFIFSGIHFDVDMGNVLQPFVSLALRTLFHAVDTILHHEDEDLTRTKYRVTHIKLDFLNWKVNTSRSMTFLDM